MNLPPRDHTPQEEIIAQWLSKFGLSYEPQAYYHPYIVDFYIPEIKTVVEADGVYGHLGKRDRKRDSELLALDDIDYIIHIKEKTNEKIKDQLWLELNNLDKGVE
jgi:very-short-patch-repair endonuclease|tara:strand:- start:5111 stop:5425 length:315 start_codon:yes stop_codon:yes gene_type:complete